MVSFKGYALVAAAAFAASFLSDTHGTVPGPKAAITGTTNNAAVREATGLDAILAGVPHERRLELSLPEGFSGSVFIGPAIHEAGKLKLDGVCLAHADIRGLGSSAGVGIYAHDGTPVAAQDIAYASGVGVQSTCVGHIMRLGSWTIIYAFQGPEGLVRYAVKVNYLPALERFN